MNLKSGLSSSTTSVHSDWLPPRIGIESTVGTLLPVRVQGNMQSQIQQPDISAFLAGRFDRMTTLGWLVSKVIDFFGNVIRPKTAVFALKTLR